MTADNKVRIGLLLASIAISALAVLATAHGFHVGPLDGTGPGPY